MTGKLRKTFATSPKTATKRMLENGFLNATLCLHRVCWHRHVLNKFEQCLGGWCFLGELLAQADFRRIGQKSPESYREYGAGIFAGDTAKGGLDKNFI